MPDGDGNLDLGDDVEGQFAGPALCGYLDGRKLIHWLRGGAMV